MSKLETLDKFLILTEKCSPAIVVEVLSMLDELGAKWSGNTHIYDAEMIIKRILEQEVSVKVVACGSEFELTFAQERFYRENPEHCKSNFIGAEYFLFLVEDHLYEKQAGGTPK